MNPKKTLAVVIVLVGLAFAGAPPVLRAEDLLTIARDGKTQYTLVDADQASELEQKAFQELGNFLGRVTGAGFPVMAESGCAKNVRGIYVGWTKFAAEHGIETAKLGEEEWVIRCAGENLILTGGRPRGTLYVVYAFLEQQVGCLWLARDTEIVPFRPTLELPKPNVHAKPYIDVDGQTATALFVEALRELGGMVSYHIAIRAQESHGVSLPVLRTYLEGVNPPHVVLTCDTGIAAFDAAEYARSRHVDLLITDHHELAGQLHEDAWRLPSAEWIVTPRFLANKHPLATLPGVGVAYKLIEALYGQVGRAELAETCLDLVALGIVADVAYQSGDARYLLQRGLDHIDRILGEYRAARRATS